MGNKTLFAALAMTFSVTAFARFPALISENVPLAFSKTPGRAVPSVGRAELEVDDSGRSLTFQTQGQMSDRVVLDNESLILSLKAMNYMNYGERAQAEAHRAAGAGRTAEIFFYHPVLAVQYERSVHLYAVSEAGILMFLGERLGLGASLVHALIKDPSGLSGGLEMDLVRIGTGALVSYYSPEMRTYVAARDIVKIKDAHDASAFSTADLVRVRMRDARTADAFAAAEETLRKTRYLYTSEQEKTAAVTAFERAIHQSDTRDPLLPRRLAERDLALRSPVLSGSEKSAHLHDAMSKYSEALAAARSVLQTAQPVTVCDPALRTRRK